jgi:hypothetical protein
MSPAGCGVSRASEALEPGAELADAAEVEEGGLRFLTVPFVVAMVGGEEGVTRLKLVYFLE